MSSGGLAFPIWGSLSCPEKNRCRAVDVEETTMIPVLSPPKKRLLVEVSLSTSPFPRLNVNPWSRWHY